MNPIYMNSTPTCSAVMPSPASANRGNALYRLDSPKERRKKPIISGSRKLWAEEPFFPGSVFQKRGENRLGRRAVSSLSRVVSTVSGSLNSTIRKLQNDRKAAKNPGRANLLLLIHSANDTRPT